MPNFAAYQRDIDQMLEAVAELDRPLGALVRLENQRRAKIQTSPHAAFIQAEPDTRDAR